jgi:hypothetical protein
MDVKEAAKRLELSPTTVYGLCASGALGHHRKTPSRQSPIVITEAHVAAYLADREREASEAVAREQARAAAPPKRLPTGPAAGTDGVSRLAPGYRPTAFRGPNREG